MRLGEQVIRFGVVGVVAFLIDFGLMIALSELFGVAPLLSAAISFVVSLIANYMMSMRYVFARRDDMSRRREFVVFVVLSVIGLGINELVMWIGYDGLGFDYRLVKIAATAVVMVWNFASRKRWLEGKGSQRAEPACREGSLLNAVSVALGTLYGVCMVLGFQLDQGSDISWTLGTFLAIVALSLVFSFLTRLLFSRLARLRLPQTDELSGKEKIASLLVIALPQLLMFAIMFPGEYGYDAGYHIWQVTSDEVPLSKTYSVPYTLFLGGFVKAGLALGDVEAGFAVAMFIQASVLVVISWQCSLYTFTLTRRRLVFFLSSVFFGLFPFILIMRISSAQDSFFAAFFSLLCMQLVMLGRVSRECRRPDRQTALLLVKISVTAFAMMLMRNNGLYALVPALIATPFVVKSPLRWPSLAALCSSAAVFLLVSGPIYAALGVSSVRYWAPEANTSLREIVGIPSQQIARVYNENPQSLTDEELAELSYYYDGYDFSDYLTYSEISDSTKGRLNTENAGQDMFGYISMYLDIGDDNAQDYTEAFLLNSLGFWYPLKSHPDTQMYHPYIEYRMMDAQSVSSEYTNIERQSFIPQLDQWLTYWLDDDRYTGSEACERYGDNAVFAVAINCGTYFFIYAAALAFAICQKRREYALALILVGGLFLTYLLSPVCLFRYAFAFISCIPVLMCVFVPNAALAKALQACAMTDDESKEQGSDGCGQDAREPALEAADAAFSQGADTGEIDE